MRISTLFLLLIASTLIPFSARAQYATRVAVRDPLVADRTYFVRTDGNDDNSGLINDSAGAWLTIQHAIDVVSDDLDIGGFNVVIQVADGAYNAPVVLRSYVGRGVITLRGNTTTPANVTITTNGTRCITAFRTPPWTIEGFSLSTTGVAANCIHATGTRLTLGRMAFRSSSQFQIQAVASGEFFLGGNIDISGNAVCHVVSDTGSLISGNAVTVTLSGTPAFSHAFAVGVRNGVIFWKPTFVGTATGQRYNASLNAVIDTTAGGVNFFPGNLAGATATGGQYN